MEDRIKRAIRTAATEIDEFAGKSKVISYPQTGLPDKEKIIAVTERLRGIMFPGFFSSRSADVNDYSTGYELSEISRELLKQSYSAFLTRCDANEARALSNDAVEKFISELPNVQKLLATDVEAIYVGDPAASSEVDVIFSYPGLFAITVFRLAHVLYTLNVPLIPRMMTEYAHSQTGIDINAGAQIGSYFFIDHGTGVVIGETTVIGDYVKIYQGVTLGALSTRKGHMLSGTKRHPTIGSRVTVYSGASILGGDTVIGDDCLIGSNAFVTGSVPDNTKVSITSPELKFRENRPAVWENS